MNTKSLREANRIFSYCSSLSKIPNISLWNQNNEFNITRIFDHYSSLIELPDISKFKIKIDNDLFIYSSSTNENNFGNSIFSLNNKRNS